MTWKTFIGITDYKNLDELKKVCTDIYLNDSTFSYKMDIVKGKFKERIKALLVINSPNKDQAYQRGEWFINKIDKCSLDTFYWVKEVK